MLTMIVKRQTRFHRFQVLVFCESRSIVITFRFQLKNGSTSALQITFHIEVQFILQTFYNFRNPEQHAYGKCYPYQQRPLRYCRKTAPLTSRACANESLVNI
ncbi:MAG: hypothetical protein ACI86M_003745 [Saprospiraceae bacterium]|jgi:hypothetical protein